MREHASLRRHSRILVGFGSGLIAAGSITGCSSGHHSTIAPTPSAASPASLLQEATVDARGEGWAHLEVTDHQGGQAGTITQDSGPSEGHQSIKIGAVVAQVVWVDAHAYIMGNAQAVVSYFGFPQTDGSTLAGHWLSIPSTNPDYATVTDGVDLDSALAETDITDPTSETARTTRDGQAVIGIRGVASGPDADHAPAVLYVSTSSAHPLPVEFDASSVQDSEQAVFSAWNTPVRLTAPSNAEPATATPGTNTAS